ncbi:hypothetical protein [Cohaesibacter haloalkalitolerans]|uniref:hypothetical protein n=1 Tax=Cohaesibacter haloalkalitolerans TaxID=1162980 RepID=UPI0013C3F178|nr:hypothetical protein [Cohaesibacter haloalkalitolerans]
MKLISKLLLASALILSTQAVLAAERVWSPSNSCQYMKRLVIDRGSVLVGFPIRAKRGYELVFSKFERQACIENATYHFCSLFRVPTADMAECTVGYVESRLPDEEIIPLYQNDDSPNRPDRSPTRGIK